MVVYVVTAFRQYYDDAEIAEVSVFNSRDLAQEYVSMKRDNGQEHLEWKILPQTVYSQMPDLLWLGNMYDDERSIPYSRQYHDSVVVVDKADLKLNTVKESRVSSKVTRYNMNVKAQTLSEATDKCIKLLLDYKDTKDEVTYQ